MKITDYLKKNTVFLDGGTGTLLQAAGLPVGELPERWNITYPETVRKIHRDYFDAGSNIVSANTFGANIFKFSKDELEKIIASAVENVRVAMGESKGTQQKWIALDIGPSGRMLKPLGDLDFEDAVAAFAETVRLGVKYGVDLFFIQTMNDSLETKAALLAVKENSDLPGFVANAYGEDGKLMTGASPSAMVAMLEGMGADAIGVNCSFGPDALSSVVDEYLKYSSVPVILKPNAGLPRLADEEVVYDISASDFAGRMADFVSKGVRIVGGCCGTDAEYIAKTVGACCGIAPTEITGKTHTLVSSYTHSVEIGGSAVLIGERINPTGKPRFKSALLSGDMDYILNEAVAEEDAGAHILDVNVGAPGVDEEEMLCRAVSEIQAVTNLPLQLDSSNPAAMEKALRRYNGKAMINSVNGKRESMDAIFPLVKKYGGVVVALTLDGNGIPERAEDRVEIARKILTEAEKYGIEKKDIIFDPLVMAISAGEEGGIEALRAVEMIKNELGCNTTLGISNISYGLPGRDYVNGAFFTMALCRGLSAAIINPHSTEIMKAYHTYRAVAGQDKGFADYIAFADGLAKAAPEVEEAATKSDLQRAIVKGLKDEAAAITAGLIGSRSAMDIVEGEIIPALNTVGDGFENKKIYLPQLLMSAEAARSCVTVIKSAMPEEKTAQKGRVILATVKGDIHDIGKNIVKLVMENYGFAVTDLGKDVSPEMVLSEAVRLGADIVGLSALMTTTLPAMEETVRLLRFNAPRVKIMVGGAVMTADYAAKIGADGYAADAMGAVRCAEELLAR